MELQGKAKLSDDGLMYIAYESGDYVLAHLKLSFPEGKFSKELHCVSKIRSEGKLIGLGFAWMSTGKDLQDFKRIANECSKSIQHHIDMRDTMGSDPTKWTYSFAEFEYKVMPMYKNYINIINNMK